MLRRTFQSLLPAVLLGLGAIAQGRTELLVYTALEPDPLAEKANPQADVVWGLAATSLMLLDKEGMLQPYAPKGLEAIKRPCAIAPTRPSGSA
jgi:iron(III) transport system substrate-binding protein